MYYQRNKLAAIFNNTMPTKTDQADAKNTDINIIVGQAAISGTVPGRNKEPIYADFSQLPTDLREMIETTRNIETLRKTLPPQLREKPIEELLTLTPDAIAQILTPTPAPTPAPPNGDEPT